MKPKLSNPDRIHLLDRLLEIVPHGDGWGFRRRTEQSIAGLAREFGIGESLIRSWCEPGTALSHWQAWAIAMAEGASDEEALDAALGKAPSPLAGQTARPTKAPSAGPEAVIYALERGLSLTHALDLAKLSRDVWDEWMRLADSGDTGCQELKLEARAAEARCMLACHEAVLADGKAPAILSFMARRWPDSYGLRPPEVQTEVASPLADRSDEELAELAKGE